MFSTTYPNCCCTYSFQRIPIILRKITTLLKCPPQREKRFAVRSAQLPGKDTIFSFPNAATTLNNFHGQQSQHSRTRSTGLYHTRAPSRQPRARIAPARALLRKWHFLQFRFRVAGRGGGAASAYSAVSGAVASRKRCDQLQLIILRLGAQLHESARGFPGAERDFLGFFARTASTWRRYNCGARLCARRGDLLRFACVCVV